MDNNTTLQTLINTIEETYTAFINEVYAGTKNKEKLNRAALKRARKLTLALQAQLKEFRKESM